MADQTVRIANMPESGSPARVAYDLYIGLRPARAEGTPFEDRKKAMLDLYAECLEAARGARGFPNSPT